MLQVSTGQGKSVILAALSTYLALVGFEVYAACHSQYLSSRDYNEFKQLFNCLGLCNKIRYNIFPQICKMIFDEQPEAPFTQKINQLIMVGGSFWDNIRNFFQQIIQIHKNNKVLLIDEVDCFIDENYIGQSYLPSITIKLKSIKQLLDFVWSLRKKKNIKPEMIIKSKQFKNVCKQIKNPILIYILKNQTYAMIRDLLNFTQDKYSLIDGKIFYKQVNGLSDKIHYGYRTVFSYYQQYELQRININQLNDEAVIRLTIAAFSSAKLPLYFHSIIGVAGTLQSMSNVQRKIFNQTFGIQKNICATPIYNKSNRTIQFKKCWNKHLFSQIVKNIDQQNEKKRPVIVFFATNNQTQDFFNSNQFKKYKINASIVTHEVQRKNRQLRINISTQESKITLLTKDFIRGTDFKLVAKILKLIQDFMQQALFAKILR